MSFLIELIKEFKELFILIPISLFEFIIFSSNLSISKIISQYLLFQIHKLFLVDDHLNVH